MWHTHYTYLRLQVSNYISDNCMVYLFFEHRVQKCMGSFTTRRSACKTHMDDSNFWPLAFETVSLTTIGLSVDKPFNWKACLQKNALLLNSLTQMCYQIHYQRLLTRFNGVFFDPRSKFHVMYVSSNYLKFRKTSPFIFPAKCGSVTGSSWLRTFPRETPRAELAVA